MTAEHLPAPGSVGLARVVGAAGRGELCWVGADGTPAVEPVTPLWHDGAVWLALPYSRRREALAAAAAGDVALVLTASQDNSGQDRLLRARAVLVATGPDGSTGATDPTDLLVRGLLPQHLAKHPPSRALADSVMLRREHWWYVPRLLLRLEAAALTTVPARPDPRDSWLQVSRRSDGTPAVTVLAAARVTAAGGTGPGAHAVAPDAGARRAADVPALLYACDTSPDQERVVEQRVPGRLVEGRFVPADGVPTLPPLPGPPGLLERWQRQRRLKAACVAGLREAGRA